MTRALSPLLEAVIEDHRIQVPRPAVGAVRALSVALLASSLFASAGPAVEDPPQSRQLYEVPYNGAYTFVRIRYGAGGGGLAGFGRRGRGGGSNWSHDYPNADRNMQRILDEFTSMHPNTHGSNVLDLEDPEIFKYPVLYMSEPGWWQVTEEGARNLREHLLRGGFIIFDDFDGPGHWENWEAQMRFVLPEYEPIPLETSHPVWDTFFYLGPETIYLPHPFSGARPQYLGIFEDNDPSKRMLAMVNYDQDLAEFWEYAATGFFPVDPTNDAFKLGVNYIIFGLTR